MGQIEEKNKVLNKALGNYKKAIELDSKHTDAKVKLATIYAIAGTDDYIKKAKDLLAQVSIEQPDNTEAKFVSATIKYKAGDVDQAIKDMEAVIVKDKNLVGGIGMLSNIYAANKHEDKAIRLLKAGTLDNPDSVYLKTSLASLLSKQKDFIGAEKYLKDSLLVEPEKYSLQVALSSFYAVTNQLDKAESVLRAAIAQEDEDVDRYLVLIQFLSSRVSVQHAEDELKKIILNKPDLYELKFAQANFYITAGKRVEAKEVLKTIISDKTYDVEGVKARNLLAGYLLEEGNQDLARAYIEEVISEYPNDNDALVVTAKLALMNGDAISAINGLRTVVKNDPRNTEASLLLAQAYEKNKETGLAEQELKRSIEENPINDETHINYTRYLASKGRTDDALNVIDKALTYFKGSYDLLDVKLKIVASQSKDSEIVDLLDLMEQVDSTKADVNLKRGQYYLSKKDVDSAIKEFETAYDKSKIKLESLELIVRSYLFKKKPDLAIARLEKAIDKNAKDSIAIMLLGQVYLSQKKVKAARDKFRLATEISEKWAKPYVDLANTYLIEKDTKQAINVYLESIPKVSNKASVRMQLAGIYERNKDFSSAMKVYQDVIKENSSNKIAANNYASLLLDHGDDKDISKALKISESFIKIQQPALQDTLAWAYAKSGDSAKAVEILKPVVAKSPKLAIFRYHLGYALYQSGDKAAAKSHLEVAVSSKQDFSGKEDAIKLLKSITI